MGHLPLSTKEQIVRLQADLRKHRKLRAKLAASIQRSQQELKDADTVIERVMLGIERARKQL